MKRLVTALIIAVFTTGGFMCAATADTTTFTLSNGLRVIYRSVSAHPLVSVQLFVRRGAIDEKANQAGLAFLTQTVMAQGTAHRTSAQLAADMEDIGTSLSSDVEHDYCSLGFGALKDNAARAMELLADIALNPSFPKEEIEKERINMLAGIKSRQDYIFNATQDMFNATFYGDHPYSWPETGKASTVKTFTRAELVDWHRRHFTAGDCLLVVAGDISLDDARALAEKYFSAMAKAEKLPPLPAVKTPSRTVEIHTTDKFQQAMLMTGWPCPDISHPDYPVIKVINAMMGGRMSGRLFTELREKMSLGYEVSSFYPSRRALSRYVVYLGLKAENLDKAKKRVAEMIEELRTTPVSEKELRDSKNYIRGVYLMDHQTVNRQAWYLGWWEIMGGGYADDDTYLERLRAVTPEDVQRVAKQYFTDAAMVQIELTPKKK